MISRLLGDRCGAATFPNLVKMYFHRAKYLWVITEKSMVYGVLGMLPIYIGTNSVPQKSMGYCRVWVMRGMGYEGVDCTANGRTWQFESSTS